MSAEKITASKKFLYFCLAVILGIFFDSIIKIPRHFLLGFLIPGIILISVLQNHKKLAIAGFCILFFVFGVWRHQIAETQNLKSGLNAFNDTQKIIDLTGVVAEEPAIRENSLRLIIRDIKIKFNDEWQNISGKVLVATRRYPEYKYGNELRISGKLKAPSEDIEGFNYKNYLQKDGIYSIMEWPKIEIIGEGLGNPVMGALFRFKDKFKEASQKLISPPQLGILEALIFGDEQNISKEWKDKLNITGTRHIAAVSGMNITILSAILLSLLLSFGLWRQQAFYFAITALVLYILMIGAPASAVRAGVIAVLFMSAQYFGRLSLASRAVAIAAVFMLLLNPLILSLDVGFQLSFLAILGIIYLQPKLLGLFQKVPDPKFFPVRTTLSATLSAQIFTLPVLLYNFGYISIVSLITNILIVPILVFATVLIFIFGLGSMIFFPLGWVLSFPVWVLLTYIIKIIDIFSKIPFNLLEIGNINRIWVVIFYIILTFVIVKFRKKNYINV